MQDQAGLGLSAENLWPTGPAKDEDELGLLLTVLQGSGWNAMVDLLKRTKAAANKNLRSPRGKSTDSLYNYGYNNGCLDQIDMILNLPEQLELQRQALKTSTGG